MNEIDDLKDHENSVLLAKAIGWKIVNSDRIEGLQFVYDIDEVQVHVTRDARFLPNDPFNLYAPAHMALAWRVLNWAEDLDMSTPSLNWKLFEYPLRTLACESPGDAQRLWLDKILALAIEAGLVELEKEKE